MITSGIWLAPRLPSGPIIWALCVSLSFHTCKMWTILQLARQVDAGLKTHPTSGAQEAPGSKPPLQWGGYSTPWLFAALPKPPRQFPPVTLPHPPLRSSSRPFKGKQGSAPGPGFSLRRWHPALSRGTKVKGLGRPGAAAQAPSPPAGASGAQWSPPTLGFGSQPSAAWGRPSAGLRLLRSLATPWKNGLDFVQKALMPLTRGWKPPSSPTSTPLPFLPPPHAGRSRKGERGQGAQGKRRGSPAKEVCITHMGRALWHLPCSATVTRKQPQTAQAERAWLGSNKTFRGQCKLNFHLLFTPPAELFLLPNFLQCFATSFLRLLAWSAEPELSETSFPFTWTRHAHVHAPHTSPSPLDSPDEF